MRVAFVHDYLTQIGGAERVLLEMHRLHPDAPIYTSLYDARACGNAFGRLDVRTTWLQRLPYAAANFRAMLPLYPRAFESLDFSGYDLVISSSTSFAKGIRVRQGTMHISYMNTPTRFLWYPQEYVQETTPRAMRPLLRAVTPALRRWDLAAAQRPFRIIANSLNVARRVQEVYGRPSDVLPCPVEVDAFASLPDVGDYYLVACRLLTYKRVALAIEACNELQVPLIVAGSGPDERRLRSLAGSTVRFAGRVADAQRRLLFARARALIVPGIEDFGLVPLEAAASGRPTIAFRAGGALETIAEDTTGIFFDEPSSASLAAALRGFRPHLFDRSAMRAHAEEFSPARFRARLHALLERYAGEFGPATQKQSVEASTVRPAVSA